MGGEDLHQLLMQLGLGCWHGLPLRLEHVCNSGQDQILQELLALLVVIHVHGQGVCLLAICTTTYHQPALPLPGLLQPLALISEPACRQLLGVPSVELYSAFLGLARQFKDCICFCQGLRETAQSLFGVFGLQ